MTSMEERSVSRRIRSLAVAGGLMLAAGATMALLAPSAAQADDPAGSLTVAPAHGSDLLAPQVHTSGGCPTTSDAYNAVLTGPGAFAPGFLITATQDPGFSTTAGFDVQLGVSFKDAATELGTTITAGDYVVTVNCVDSFSGDVKAKFVGLVRFTSSTEYTFDPTVTPSPTASPSPTATATPTGTASPTPSATPTPTDTEPTTDPAETPTPDATTTSPATGLPITGPPTVELVGLGTFLIAAGAAAIAAAGAGYRAETARP
jgi:hypothetical protein